MTEPARKGLPEIDKLLDFLQAGRTVKGYSELARRLSRIAKRKMPWSWRYIQSTHRGTLEPSERLRDAILEFGACLNGKPALTIAAKEQTIRSKVELHPDTLILVGSRLCAGPRCNIWFIPVVHNQKYHSPTCREKKR